MIIGVKYEYTHVGFTYPSIMNAFKEHCVELIYKNIDKYKIVVKFLWGIKIQNFSAFEQELISLNTLLKNSGNISLSDKSLSFLEDYELENYEKLGKNIFKFFTSARGIFFTDLFIECLQKAKEEDSPFISIGSMAVRPDMVEDYGWDYPNKIPEEVKNF